jgi:hypothetical protein
MNGSALIPLLLAGALIACADNPSPLWAELAAQLEHAEVMPLEAGPPRFVQPLGTGTTIDVTSSACLELPIAIDDPDSVSVALRQEAPYVYGAELEQTGAFEGRWTFCPTAEQIADDDRYALRLVADDGETAPTVKHYLVMLRHGDAPDTPPDEAPSEPVGLCEACSGDADCGGSNDLCVWWDDEPRCLAGCDSVDDCPAGYFCSFAPLGSVDGESARQCLPNDYQCAP